MCTVTWRAHAGGYDLFMNRDELSSRGPALPPSVRERSGVRVVAPVDSDGGGSWVAANEHGLAVCLLNYYPPRFEPQRRAFESRGRLVIELAASATVSEVSSALPRYPLESYRPFTLFVMSPSAPPLLLRWAGAGSLHTVSAPVPPLTSSSFDSESVIAAREQAYSILVGDDPSAGRLAAYHRSHEPAKGPFSVCAHRDDGGSRSLTRVSVDSGGVRLSYSAGPPCEGAPVCEIRLPRRPPPARTPAR